MRREDILALAEENRRLRQEIYRLEEDLLSAHQEESEVLRRRLAILEQKANSQYESELRATRGALAAVIAGVALSLGLAGGLASLLFSATNMPQPTKKKFSSTVPSHTTSIPETSTLFVNGDPTQAKVLLDGVFVGESPLFITISPGHHKLDILNEDQNTIDQMEFFAQPSQTTRATYHAPKDKVKTGSSSFRPSEALSEELNDGPALDIRN
jgi:hypothetical protein